MLRANAPNLKRHFHKGTPAGEPGMRFKMIGYGKFHYSSTAGTPVEWAVHRHRAPEELHQRLCRTNEERQPLVAQHVAKLNALRTAPYNFSFTRTGDLNEKAASALFADAAHIV